ncbi:hypothetical protein CIP107506_02429 [Corynebacterium diphtheriae]|nr:hypothetical protein CIP107506_02429 [Corynebacterium diphtheriae]
MMVVSHTVWCGAVVVVVFVVVCVCSYFFCVLVRCWVSGTTWLFWLIIHVVLCGVAGCVLVVLLWDRVVGVLCENCIVDASNLYSLIVLGVLFVTCVLFVKGTRWMPWHYEPMKDV